MFKNLGMIDATRKTYFSPDDDCQGAILELINAATKKIRIADYSFNLDPLVELLIEKKTNGVDVALVLDRSQAAGPTEKPEVQKLVEAGIPLVIGTSSKGKIMHLKVAIVDDKLVASGSYNFTGTAELEDNVLEIESNSERAAVFSNYWQKIHDWIVKHESTMPQMSKTSTEGGVL